MQIWRQMSIPTRWGWCADQQKVEEKWCDRFSSLFFGVYTIGFCVSCFSSERIYSTERRKIGIESHRRTRGTTSQFGTEKVHREASFRKCEFHECNPCAPKFAERTRDETLHQERCACRVAWDLANHVCKLKKTDNAAFYYPFEARAMRAPTDSGASRHMLCKKELSWDEMETLRRSRNSTTVVTASGEVQTNVEAHEYVHDLDLFVTGSLLEETSAVLSTLRRTRWTTAVDQTREQIMQNGRLRTSCCLGLPSNSGTNSSSLSQDSSSTSSSLATERSDEPAPGNWRESPKTQNRNERTKRDTNRASDDRLRDLPEWFHTHFSKDRNCEVCLRTKMTRAPCRRCTGEAAPLAEKFGDFWWQQIAKFSVRTVNLETITDTQSWYKPWKTQTSQKTEKSLRRFLEPSEKPKVIYTDNSLEFGKPCEDLSWNHRTSTPHRSETNGIAERAVRRVKEGTSAVLLQSGLDEKWWADSMECCCCLRHVQDLLADVKTPYERRFGETLKSPIIRGISSDFCTRPVQAPPFWQESFTWNSPRISVNRGVNLERRFWSQTF